MASPIRARKLSAHPYYPQNLDIPHYAPNELGDMAVLGSFAAVCGAVTVLAFAMSGVSKRGAASVRQSRMTFAQRLLFTWCILSGAIHIAIEGYFVVFWKTLPSLQTPVGQVWKEYAKADSRYLYGEACVWIIEAITAFAWGPLLLFVAARMFFYAHRHQRYLPWLLMISTGQLYGTIVYFYTSMKVRPAGKEPLSGMAYAHDFLGRLYSDDTVPEPFYFWVYYVFMNFIWVVAPGLSILYSLVQLDVDPVRAAAAQRAHEQVHPSRAATAADTKQGSNNKKKQT
ncbi:hypothetical protein RI367_002577 [Sorochytrium milnesiophthora]